MLAAPLLTDALCQALAPNLTPLPSPLLLWDHHYSVPAGRNGLKCCICALRHSCKEGDGTLAFSHTSNNLRTANYVQLLVVGSYFAAC